MIISWMCGFSFFHCNQHNISSWWIYSLVLPYWGCTVAKLKMFTREERNSELFINWHAESDIICKQLKQKRLVFIIDFIKCANNITRSFGNQVQYYIDCKTLVNQKDNTNNQGVLKLELFETMQAIDVFVAHFVLAICS